MGKRLQYDFDEDIDDMYYQTLYRSQIKRKRNRNFEEKLDPNRKRARTKHKMQTPSYSDFPFEEWTDLPLDS